MAYFSNYNLENIVKNTKPIYSRAPSKDLSYLIDKSEYLQILRERDNEKSMIYTEQKLLPLQYTKNAYFNNLNNYTCNIVSKTYYFTPEIFLNPVRPKTRFIGATEQVKGLIEETFKLTTGIELPENIAIRICTKEELKQIHSQFGSWSDSIQGFAINRKKLKEIIVKNAYLDELMLTIGHEIGHVFTKSLSNKHDEEAKAFSFAVEWAKTIKKHNLSNLAICFKDNIDFEPAKNGLHDIAFLFVKNLLNKGKEAMQIHWDLVKGYISLWGFYN